MRKFNVGDRVRILDGGNIDHYRGGWANCMEEQIGNVHVIIEVCESQAGSNGYYLEGAGGFIYDERGLERVVDNRKIVITTDGKTTLARLYEDNKVIKSAEAKCSPDDKFNFTTGAKIAFERLLIAKKIVGAKYKVVGKSYPRHRFCEGDIVELTYDDGSDIPKFKPIESAYLSAQYVNMKDVEFIENPKQESEGNTLFNGRAVYIGTEPSKWTNWYALAIGKIYTFVNGAFTDDSGIELSLPWKASELKSQGFIEIKE